MVKIALLCRALAVVCCLVGTARADELAILTSYEAEVYEPIIEAFSKHHPDIHTRFLNKNTNAAVDEIMAGNERRFDLFWSSSPEAFEMLADAGRLADLGHGLFTDFAYSASGWTWREADKGPVPRDWNGLLDPQFAQSIAMSHPMRSGSTHSMIEAVLQDRGWQAGWAWVLELAGNLKTLSARSFGVIEGVEAGEFSIGLTIDFLALTHHSDGLKFRYGRPVIIVPARIAALQNGRHADAARLFVDFLLSPEGQRLLTRPDVRRIPLDPDIRAEYADTLDPEVRAALTFSWSRYDPKLASRRYWEVKQLFETFVARDLLLRRELWQRLRALRNASRTDRQRVRALLTWMPLTEHQARSTPKDRETLLAWSERSHTILTEADALLRRLESQE